jgi:hypothetical protein
VRTRPTPAAIDDDDRPVGRLLSRREILALFGVTGATAVAASLGTRVLAQDGSAAAGPTPAASALPADLPSCIVRPELTEGPYFVDTRLERSDIRSDPTTGILSEGLPLAITFLVSRIEEGACGGCPRRRLALRRPGHLFGGPRSTLRHERPGLPARLPGDRRAGRGDDALSAPVFANPPYAEKGTQDIPNSQDGIFRQGGELLLLDVRAEGDGLASTFPIGVQVS